MPHEVTLSLSLHGTDATPITTTTLIAESVTLTDETAKIEGVDPAHYPAAMRKYIDFHAYKHTAVIDTAGPLTVDTVQPTDKPIPATVPSQ
jgi:pyocin large subunit-like protein